MSNCAGSTVDLALSAVAVALARSCSGSGPTSWHSVVCGSGPGRTRPHNRRYLRHHGRKQPQLSRTATVKSNSSVCFKCLFQTCLKLDSSRQTQGIVVTALSRRHELRVQCAASASCSSAEAASSVLSTLPESWIAYMGRANSSTRHPPRKMKGKCVLVLEQNLLEVYFVFWSQH